MQRFKSREEVPEKYKWDLTDFYKDEAEFEQSLNEAIDKVKNLTNYIGCTKDANLLYEFLTKEVEAISLWENLYVYAYLIHDQELGLSESVERLNKTRNLNGELNKNLSFFAPELLKLSKEKYAKLFEENNKLLEYKFELDRIYRDKDYILEENEEKIVSELVNSMNHFEKMSSTLLNNAHDYGEIELDDGTIEKITTTNYRKIMRKSNRENRKKIYNSFNKVLDQYSAIEASFLNGYVQAENSLSKIHHHKSSWESKLFSMNMPNKVYDVLVSSIENNLKPFRRYFELKRKALKLDELHFYDLPLDMATSKREYTIEEAQEIIREALLPFGEDYLECFDKIIENRYIDYCQYPGKCNGGYSFSTLDHDSRILMSFNDDLDSVSTIAHEAGHNVHHQLVGKNNPLIYRDITSLVAEVASLTNECLLSSYLAVNGKSSLDKKAGIANILGVIVSNFYGSVRECRMEQEMYDYVLDGNALTKDYLDNLTQKSIEKYYGDSIVIDEYAKCGWITRSHYYMNFYLYNYSISIAVASYVASKILDGDEKMLENYMRFLKTGSDVWPIDAFKILGVDLEDKQVYETAIKYFDNMLDLFEKINEEV